MECGISRLYLFLKVFLSNLETCLMMVRLSMISIIYGLKVCHDGVRPRRMASHVQKCAAYSFFHAKGKPRRSISQEYEALTIS